MPSLYWDIGGPAFPLEVRSNKPQFLGGCSTMASNNPGGSWLLIDMLFAQTSGNSYHTSTVT